MSPRPLFPFSDFQRLFSHHLFHVFPTQKGPDPFSTEERLAEGAARGKGKRAVRLRRG